MNNKDEQTNQFVKACRLYNRGLVNYKYILKLIKEYVPNYSLSSFIKKIPDQSKPNEVDKDTNMDTKQQILLQQMMMMTFNQISSKHIFQNAFKKDPQLYDKFIKSYRLMIQSFE